MNGSRKTEQYRTAVQGRGVAEVWHELPDGVKYGDLCFQAERYGDALESYLKALAAVPARAQRDLHARLHFRIAGCYMRRANYRLALDHLDRARQALPRHVDRIQLAKVYGLRGQIMGNLGQYDRAERYLLWAKKLLSETNEHEELAEVEMRLGHVYARRGQFEEAPRSFLNALATFRRIGHQSGEAKALNALGLQHKNACQWREAVHYLEQARVIAERGGHQLLGPHLNLGLCHLKVGKWELAEQNLKVAERIAHELGKQTDIVRVQLTQGMLAMRRRHWNEALTLFNTAGSVATQNDYRREAILAQEFLGELYLEMGDLDAAEQNLQAALPLARELAAEGDLVDEILRRLSDLRLAQGRFDEAIPLAEESLRLVERNGDRYERPSCIRALALAQLSSGNREHGERLMESALLGFEEIAEAYQKGVTHMRYGRFLAAAAVGSGSAADLEAAAVQFQRAYGVFVDLDARTAAAHAAFERASLECKFKRLEEAASYRMKARRILPPEADPVLASQLEGLGAELEAAFTERWSAGGDVLTSLREMKRLFQGATGTEGVLEELTRLAVTRSRSARGCVAHVTDGNDVRVIAAYGWSTEDAAGLLDAMAGILETNDEDNRPQWSNNAKEDPRFQHLAAEFQTESLVLLPLTLTDNRTGFLYVDKQASGLEAGYQEGELNLLTILAHLAALSIVERWNLALAQENQQLRARIEGEDETRFVTANAELKDTLRLVSKVANSPVSILIEGETGTGKGLLAQVIHDASNRAESPFVQINCAALPEQLLESELFGHVKGAFTGASYNKTGLFKEAEEGTLFLDEVDKTSLAVQAKLLHVLDSKEVRPVGSVKSYKVDTRVICATNTNLRERIKAGEFLEDLYYRLNDFILKVPPLRDRREDIPLLIDHFLKKFCHQYDRPAVRLSAEVRRVLLDGNWRGNVRELEKTVRRLVVLADDNIPAGVDLLAPELLGKVRVRKASGPQTLREEVARTERRVIAESLRANGWNKSQVARDLKISYPCLLKKIKDFGLEPA